MAAGVAHFTGEPSRTDRAHCWLGMGSSRRGHAPPPIVGTCINNCCTCFLCYWLQRSKGSRTCTPIKAPGACGTCQVRRACTLLRGWCVDTPRAMGTALCPGLQSVSAAHATDPHPCLRLLPHAAAAARCRPTLLLLLHSGSDKFHVQWTGVAEVLGGLGLCLGALPFDFVPDWLSPASAYGLFLLTAVVTPSNIYMYVPLPLCLVGWLIACARLREPHCSRPNQAVGCDQDGLTTLHLSCHADWRSGGAASLVTSIPPDLGCCPVFGPHGRRYTHNAPGPVPESVAPGALPWQGHLARGLMQVLLLSTLWGIATASS